MAKRPGTAKNTTTSHPKGEASKIVDSSSVQTIEPGTLETTFDPINHADITRGRVGGYSVGKTGLVVNLDVGKAGLAPNVDGGSSSKLSFSVGADEPHFRSAVSMTMVAMNNRVNPAVGESGLDQEWLWVWLKAGTKDSIVQPAEKVAVSCWNSTNPFDTKGWGGKA